MSTPSSPGWYDDPEDGSHLRYFDGVVWSKHTTPKAAPSREWTAPTAQPGRYVAGMPYQPTAGSPSGGPQPPAYPQPPSAPGQPSGSPQPWQQPGGPPKQYAGGYPQASWDTPMGMAGRPSTPDGVPLAGYGQRAGAFLIDWVIQLVIGLVLGGYFLLQAAQSYLGEIDVMRADIEAGRDPDLAALIDSIDVGQLTIYTVITVAVFFLYQYLFLTRSGQTPGKMVVGISVRERARAGVPSSSAVMRRVGLASAIFLLQLVPFVSFLTSLARLMDLLWPAWDTDKQALHDKVAGTNVVVGKQPRS